MKKYIIFFTVVVAILIYLIFFIKVDVSNYDGDGKIYTKGKGLISRGFVVEFPKFSLNRNYVAVYNLKNLPNLNRLYEINIKVLASKKNSSQIPFDGQVIMVIKNKIDQIIYEKKSMLSEWRLQNSYIDATVFEFTDYSLDKHDIIYDDGKYLSDNTKIEFSFVPTKIISDTDVKAFLTLEAGGSK